MKTIPPLQGAARVWATTALALATFMQVLDTTITNVAIPTISGDLGASVTEGTWVITSFGVANAISVLLSGWVARRFGEVRVFMVATLGFVLTSFLSGMAPSLGLLILFRVLQGLLAGPLIPLSQSLLLASYPPEKKTLALALWAMTVILAPIVGPILGGWITDNWVWGGIFFINVPVGLFVAAVALWQLRGRETETQTQPVDKVGLVLLVITISAFQIMLDLGNQDEWFSSTRIITLAIIAAVGLLFLLLWERDEAYPVLDLALFRQRNFTVGALSLSLGYLMYFGSILLLPLLMQENLGYTATQAGLALAPVGLLPVILSPLIGRFSNRIDLRLLVTLAFAVFAACYYWRTFYTPAISFGWLAWPQLVQGIGVACFFMPLTAITLSGLPPERIASAASMSNFMRTMSGTIGVSLVTALWDNMEKVHHVNLVQQINPYHPVAQNSLAALQAQGFSTAQALGLINQQITQRSYFMSATDIFYLFAVLFLLLIGLVWLARGPFSEKPADAGEPG
ncbi:DHA2 family efflux MFS transporter permease subunit [Craterilacuibacter sp. RT1T]|uniref:DHA2 family efflux MFS transporter permease subunit n=1 Tax=Craterilacuibacter sp. RT1T TaxID=2942211 RepID=UPI0020C17233|nr:DHA2 family efflux MFS transporter permease subunit [Craterilacuibacter sp. RT1T]